MPFHFCDATTRTSQWLTMHLQGSLPCRNPGKDRFDPVSGRQSGPAKGPSGGFGGYSPTYLLQLSAFFGGTMPGKARYCPHRNRGTSPIGMRNAQHAFRFPFGTFSPKDTLKQIKVAMLVRRTGEKRTHDNLKLLMLSFL